MVGFRISPPWVPVPCHGTHDDESWDLDSREMVGDGGNLRRLLYKEDYKEDITL